LLKFELNSSDKSYPHICLLPTHPHLASADFICLLLIATSAHPFLPLAFIHMASHTNRHFVLVFSSWQHIHVCYRALYAIARPSVCLSIHHTHGWISQKQLKLGSCNFHHRVAPWLWFPRG